MVPVILRATYVGQSPVGGYQKLAEDAHTDSVRETLEAIARDFAAGVEAVKGYAASVLSFEHHVCGKYGPQVARFF